MNINHRYQYAFIYSHHYLIFYHLFTSYVYTFNYRTFLFGLKIRIFNEIVFFLLFFSFILFPVVNLELIPRPARSCEDPPLYLRLRMGKPLNKEIPRSTPLMSYGKKKMRPEYWFSVPKNRVDELYTFINSWVPDLYGELSEEQVSKKK